jgi:hypothetical protein
MKNDFVMQKAPKSHFEVFPPYYTEKYGKKTVKITFLEKPFFNFLA